MRRTQGARALPVPERGWGWLRGTAGAGRAWANVRAEGEPDLHLPPMPSANRKRAAGESHSRPTTAWGVPRTPPAIRRLGGRSPVVVAWSSQSSPPCRKKTWRGCGKPFRFLSAFFSRAEPRMLLLKHRSKVPTVHRLTHGRACWQAGSKMFEPHLSRIGHRSQ